MCKKVLQRNYLTAAQLGLLLDLFVNEITRFDVAEDFTGLIAKQQ